MKRWNILFFSFLLCACATHPIPTSTIPTPSASPTLSQTPTAIPTLTATPTLTLTPIPTRTATATLTPTPITFDRNPRAVLIEADVYGGAGAVPRDVHVPIFRLYADGFVVFAGERTSLTTGLDAVVRIGQLSEAQIQNLLAFLNQPAFTNLQEYYEPRPKPINQPTAHISVYLNKAKTVRVYAPDDPSTPPIFTDAFKCIIQAIPSDAGTFVPTDGYLESTDAGTANNIALKEISDWTISDVKLGGALNGITVAGKAYDQIVALRATQPENALYREGDRLYRIRFAPNLPRAVHLTDWLGTILNAPREFDGRIFEIVGYFRGWNLLDEARGSPPVTRSDWVIADESGAMYVTGIAPAGLNPGSREDIWNVVRLTARVVYVRLGSSYLEARRVDNLTPKPSPTPTPSSSTEAAIALVKAKFPNVAQIKQTPPSTIGASTNIFIVYPRQDAIYLVFWEGWGDCPAGCINNRYYYFMVKDGIASQVGEYARIYNVAKNDFDTSGTPMWGIPK